MGQGKQGTGSMAATKRLTAIRIEKLKPDGGGARREVPDGGSLYLVVQPVTGIKSWALRARCNGRNIKVTIGRWPAVGIAEARAKAATMRKMIEDGHDPAAHARNEKAAEIERKGDTVAFRAAQFIEQHGKKNTRERTWKATERVFRLYVLPEFGHRSISEIRRKHIIDLVEGIAAEKPVQANRVLATLSKFFKWMESRDLIVASPARGVIMPTKESARTRALSEDEIRRLWKACETCKEVPAAYCDIYRLLLITGARRSEVAELRWNEINEAEATWTLPEGRSKNGESRILPLSRQALAIIARQPRTAGSPFVFASRSAFSRAKLAIDAAMKPDSNWHVHDLRRTVATNLQKLGIALHVTEKILAHKSGSFAGIVSVYQQHQYQDEMAAALAAWADRLDAIIKGETFDNGKVIKFTRRQQRRRRG
jgi:integrase